MMLLLILGIVVRGRELRRVVCHFRFIEIEGLLRRLSNTITSLSLALPNNVGTREFGN